MELADPFALLLLLLAAPVFHFGFRRRTAGLPVASVAALPAVRPTWRLRFARLLPALRVLGVVLLAVALARPRVGEANAIVPAEGIDIALSVDISSSMTTSTLAPGQTRLDVVKQVIRDFIKGRENDRIGVVVFQRDALALSPPSLDYPALDTMVGQLKSGLLPDGTGIGVGLATSLNMLRDSTAASRIVILLTDGQHNAASISPSDAADLAAALHIRVYTIGVIDERSTSGRSGVDEQLLRSMAERTGGQYFSADNPATLASVYDEIGALETSRVGREHFERFTELAPWFAAGAAALLVIEFSLTATWLRRVPA
jgi:Ca-activated chloride channel family protein